jgi:predicted phosphodiesterase
MKRILVVSDLHVGSNVAIMPEEVIIEPSDVERAQRISANSIQKVLYKEWQEMIDNVGKVDACFVMGDSCDGANQKSRGFELWTPNLHQQVSTAADLLGMIRTNKYFGVQGSFYHVGENTSSDLAVIESLEKCKTEFGTDLCVEIDGCRYHLCHEVGFSQSPVGKGTALQSELVAARLYEKTLGIFDMLVRGHRHERYYTKTELGAIVVAPCWKVRDAFAAKKGLKFKSDLGYVLLEQKDKNIYPEFHTFETISSQNIKTCRL